MMEQSLSELCSVLIGTIPSASLQIPGYSVGTHRFGADSGTMTLFRIGTPNIQCSVPNRSPRATPLILFNHCHRHHPHTLSTGALHRMEAKWCDPAFCPERRCACCSGWCPLCIVSACKPKYVFRHHCPHQLTDGFFSFLLKTSSQSYIS